MAEIAVSAPLRSTRTPWARVVPRIRRHKGAVLGTFLVVALILVAVGQDVLAPLSPT